MGAWFQNYKNMKMVFHLFYCFYSQQSKGCSPVWRAFFRLSFNDKFMNESSKNILNVVFVFSLIIIGSFVFINKANAATIYVSNSATNGYALGSDSNTYAQAQNKSTPYLTLTKATSLSIANGDTIIINDGIYNEAAAVIPARYGLTITNDSATGVSGGVIIRAATNTSRVLHLPLNGGTTQAYTIGPIVLDANNTQSTCVTIDSVNDVANLVINGTKFLNPTAYWIVSTHLTNLTMSGNWSAQSNTAGNFFGFSLSGSPTNPGTYTISNGTITQTNIGTGTNYSFYIVPTVAGMTINISDTVINKTAGATGGTLVGVYATGSGAPSLTLNNVTYNFTGASNTLTGAYIYNTLTAFSTTNSIYNFTGASATMRGEWFAPSAGTVNGVVSNSQYNYTGASATMYGVYAIGQIGVSITGGTYTYTGASATMHGVFGTNLASIEVNGGSFLYTGGPSFVSAVNINEGASVTTSCLIHGLTGDLGAPYGVGYLIMVGSDVDPGANANHITNLRVYNNNLENSNHGILLGYVTGGAVYNNITNQTVIGIISKYSTNNVYYNNIIKNVTTGGALRAKGGTGASFYNNTVTLGASGVGIYTSDGSTANTFKNNILYTSQSNFAFANILSGSATITNNVYYSTQALPAQTWNDGGNSYGTFMAWQGAGFDVGSSFSDPLFVSSSNFKLVPASPAINAGTNVSLTSDYLGNPIVGVPDIGAYEFQAPATPTSLSQYKVNGTTVITSGNLTNEDSVILKFNMSSSGYNSSDLLTPQVEIRESNISFTNTVTNSGSAVAYSGSSVEGAVTVTGLESGKAYHWQARINNPAGISAWVSMGGSPDFQVDTTAPATPTATPSPGIYNSSQSVALSATGSDYIKYSLDEIPNTCSGGILYGDLISIASSSTIYVRACDNAGNSATSTFTYTIDSVNPIISLISSNDSPTITWTTSETASSLIEYGLTSSYGSSTPETNISPRVTSHSVTISGLPACTSYHYRIHSVDNASNKAISSDQTFTTSGCLASSVQTESTSGQIDKTTGGTLATPDNALSIAIPVNFATSSANFQIHQLDKSTVIAQTSVPAGYLIAGSDVYELKALSNNTTIISSFVNPLTITMSYTTSDISGLVESTLKIYRWDNNAWHELSNCNINTSAKTISCNTNNFSVFGIFGKEPVAASNSNSMPISWSKTPIVPVGGFKITVSGNTLNFNAGSDVKKMAISLDSNFTNASLEDYTPAKQINSCSESCTVYIKFYTEHGVASEVISQTISPAIVVPAKPIIAVNDAKSVPASWLAGQILLQVESHGEAWYVNPKNNKRYYLGRPNDAFNLMKNLSLGISEKEFISWKNLAPSWAKGKLYFRPQSHGEAYYVDLNRRLHYLGRPLDAWLLLKSQGLGITNNDLAKVVVAE